MALPTLRGLSICAGIGGIDLGLRRALGSAYVTACYIEKEITAAAVLAARIEDGQLCAAPIWSDLHTFDAKPWAGGIDIVSAGIPCQPWSVAGKQRGHFDERHLWSPTYAILQRLQPAFFFLENVPGILAEGGLEPIWRDLCEVGYCVEGGFFTAKEVGAPHVRKRFFLLAYANGKQLRHARKRDQFETWQSAAKSGHDGAASYVADADDHRRRSYSTCQCYLDVGDRSQKTRWKCRAGQFTVGCAAMADAVCKGQEVSKRSTKRQNESLLVAGQSRALFQSDRDSCDGGSRQPQSLLGRIADGLREGLDSPQWSAGWEDNCARVSRICDGRATRLSMLGNAVVPAVAARAFATLVKRMALAVPVNPDLS